MSCDDELAHLFDDVSPTPFDLMPYALRVAALLRGPGALARWRRRCEESYHENRQRYERHKAWLTERNKYLTAAWRRRSTPRKPPNEGWRLVMGRAFSSGGRQTKLVQAWMPPEFDDEHKPYAGGPLPFTARHSLSIADCHLVVALIHDAARPDGGRVLSSRQADRADLSAAELREQIFYRVMAGHVSKLNGDDRVTVEDCLARVEAVTGPKAKPGAGGPSKRDLNVTEKKILAHCRKRAHKGARIADHINRSEDYTRRLLAGLVRNGFLRKPEEGGYRTV